MNSIPLIPQDKANHALYGGLAANVFAFAASFYGLPSLDAKVFGLIATAILAVGKEIADAWRNYRATGDWRKGPHGIEGLDILATVAGGLVAVASPF